jgi:hypothetical protein
MGVRISAWLLLLLGAAVGVKVNAQFDAMLHSVSLSPAALAMVDKPRVRTILVGVEALMDEPTVRAAFKTIYEDFRLLRPAGDLAVRQLASQCQAARDRADKLAALIGEEEGSADMLFPTLRRYFEAIDLSGDGRLDQAELQAACDGSAGSSVAALAAACLQEECELDEESASAPNFADFVMLVSRQQLDVESLSGIVDDGCLAEVEGIAVQLSRGASSAKNAALFEAMIERVGEWEESSEAVRRTLEANGRQGRLGLILRGCIDGVRNEKLKEALKTVYCDDNVLRAAGDIIFRLMQTAVGDARKVEVTATASSPVAAPSAEAKAATPPPPRPTPSSPAPPTSLASQEDAAAEPSTDDKGTRSRIKVAAATPSEDPCIIEFSEDPSGLIAASRAIEVASDWEWAVEYLSKGF